jgi:hypothetical protein
VSDVARLLAWFDAGELVRPDASAPNLVDLSRAVAHLCGAGGIDLSPNGRRIADTIGAADHYVFVLIDGLGMHLMERLPPDDVLRSRLAMELRTVFPTSTAPALTSLATGRWPAEHAVPGWWTYLPDAGVTSTILPFIERFSERPLGERGVMPESAFPSPALPARYRRRYVSVSPKPIAGSVSSRYFSANADYYGYESMTAAIEAIDRRIREADGATFTYFYIPFVDTAEHEHGPYAREVAGTLAHVRRRMRLLFDTMRGRARVIATADHGQIDVPPPARHLLEAGDPLIAMLRLPPSCEPRTSAFHVRGGMRAAFASAFRDRFGERFALLTIDEADELRLFGDGPMSAEMRRRLGDFVSVARGLDVIIYEPSDTLRAMKGFHGGLTADEVRVPLIVA